MRASQDWIGVACLLESWTGCSCHAPIGNYWW